MNITLNDLLTIVGESRVPSHTGQYSVVSAAKMRAAIVKRMDAYDAELYKGLIGHHVDRVPEYIPVIYIGDLKLVSLQPGDLPDEISNDPKTMRVEVDENGIITKVLGFCRLPWP